MQGGRAAQERRSLCADAGALMIEGDSICNMSRNLLKATLKKLSVDVKKENLTTWCHFLRRLIEIVKPTLDSEPIHVKTMAQIKAALTDGGVSYDEIKQKNQIATKNQMIFLLKQ